MADGKAALIALKAYLHKSLYSEPLETLEDVAKFLSACYPSLDVQPVCLESSGSPRTWVLVSTSQYIVDDDIGPYKPALLTFHPEGHYTFSVLRQVTITGNWQSARAPYEEVTDLLDTLLSNSGYLVCPGIVRYDETYGAAIRFGSKNLRVWGHPMRRHDAETCCLWHKPNNTQQDVSSPVYNACAPCKCLYHELNAIKRRAEKAASLSRHGRQNNPSSNRNRPSKCLSAPNRTKRAARGRTRRKRLCKVHSKCQEDADIGEQSEKLTAIIEDKYDADFRVLVRESNDSRKNVGESLRDVSEFYTASQSEVFEYQLSNSREVEKYMAVHRKGHRKPRLSEPLVASLKQNVQSPIRIIRPSPTPISPSYKAKAQTNVAKSKITTAGTYVPPKSHPPGSAQPVVSAPQAVSTIKQQSQSIQPPAPAPAPATQHVSTAGIFVPPNGSATATTNNRKRKLEQKTPGTSENVANPPAPKVFRPSSPAVVAPGEIFFKVDSKTRVAREKLGRADILKAARSPTKLVKYKGKSQ